MLRLTSNFLRRLFWRFGFDIVPSDHSSFPLDFDDEMVALYNYVRPYTMTSKERIHALRESIRYVVQHDIPGDIVECGVWRGGSMMAVARTLVDLGVSDRRLVLFDTYDGMTNPADIDRDIRDRPAADQMRAGWCKSCLEDVQRALKDTGYDESKCVFVKGRVEDTIPEYTPQHIALLRLDTDWYESTHHELTYLYPQLSGGGVLIIDDYGHWQGAKRAVDDYLATHNLKLFLNRVDYTARLCIKPFSTRAQADSEAPPKAGPRQSMRNNGSPAQIRGKH